jgi:hypothetical protein
VKTFDLGMDRRVCRSLLPFDVWGVSRCAMTWFSRMDGVYKVRTGSVVATRVDGIALGRQYAESRSISCANPGGWMAEEQEKSEGRGDRRRHAVSICQSDVLDEWKWRHTAEDIRLLASP